MLRRNKGYLHRFHRVWVQSWNPRSPHDDNKLLPWREASVPSQKKINPLLKPIALSLIALFHSVLSVWRKCCCPLCNKSHVQLPRELIFQGGNITWAVCKKNSPCHGYAIFKRPDLKCANRKKEQQAFSKPINQTVVTKTWQHLFFLLMRRVWNRSNLLSLPLKSLILSYHA